MSIGYLISESYKNSELKAIRVYTDAQAAIHGFVELIEQNARCVEIPERILCREFGLNENTDSETFEQAMVTGCQVNKDHVKYYFNPGEMRGQFCGFKYNEYGMLTDNFEVELTPVEIIE